MSSPTTVLYVRVSREIRDELGRIADQTGLSLALVTAEILRRGLAHPDRPASIQDRIDQALGGGGPR